MVLRSSATPQASGEPYHRGASPPGSRSVGPLDQRLPTSATASRRPGSGGFPDAYGPQREQSHRFNGKKTVEGRLQEAASRRLTGAPSPRPTARTSASKPGRATLRSNVCQAWSLCWPLETAVRRRPWPTAFLAQAGSDCRNAFRAMRRDQRSHLSRATLGWARHSAALPAGAGEVQGALTADRRTQSDGPRGVIDEHQNFS